MPLYEFVCKACGCRFEALTSVLWQDKVACPSCGGQDLAKQASLFGIGGGSSRLKAASSSCSSCSSKSCSTCR